MIENENDIRDFVRADAGGKERWVEPSIGSSYGLPDCWVAHNGHCIHLELKVGKIVGALTNTPALSFELRPGQKKEIRKMVADGLKVGLLVGLIQTEAMWFIRPCPEMYEGKIPMDVMLKQSQEYSAGSSSSEEGNSFQSGLNFIYFK